VIGPCVFRVYGAGVVVVSIEGPDVSESLGLPESRGIRSPGTFGVPYDISLSTRQYSRIAAENGVLQNSDDIFGK
jgi:hypothetical protein